MSWFFKSRRRPGWLTVNVTPEQVDIAHITRNGSQRPQVLISDSFRKEGSDTLTLARLRREFELGSYRCTTLLRSGEYQILQIEAPNVPEEEIKAAAGWKVKDMIDYPVERATVEVLTIPSGGAGAGRSASLFAIATRDETVRQRALLFEGSGNISALLESEGRALGMLCFDNQGGLLTITQGGELLLSRFLDVTVQHLTETTGERRLQVLDRVGLELQRSMDFFDRQPNSVALTRLLIQPMPQGSDVLEYLTNNLSVPVEVFDLETVLDFSRVPALKNLQRQAQCLHMLGAALRDDTRTL
jgi:MSHA biogenesis protein MshI